MVNYRFLPLTKILNALVIANLNGALPHPADFSPASIPPTNTSANNATVLSILKAGVTGRAKMTH